MVGPLAASMVERSADEKVAMMVALTARLKVERWAASLVAATVAMKVY